MASASPVEWISGFPQATWTGGYMLVLFGTYLAGFATADAFGVGPQYAWPLTDFLLTIGAMGAFTVPAVVAYVLLVPTPSTLGLMPDGLIVSLGSSRFAFRQGYRWADLRLRGRSLILPRVRLIGPRSLRLTVTQRERLASRIAPS